MPEPREVDPYGKLRAPPPTPEDELCACGGAPAILLAPHLSENPLLCFDCLREVPPERIGFGEALAERLAAWRSFHDCFYLLWLDSAEFEAWARGQLEAPESPVNQRARELVASLAAFRPTYHWWFRHDALRPLDACPRCHGALVTERAHQICGRCAIAVVT
jgi:hypothetical protein